MPGRGHGPFRLGRRDARLRIVRAIVIARSRWGASCRLRPGNYGAVFKRGIGAGAAGDSLRLGGDLMACLSARPGVANAPHRAAAAGVRFIRVWHFHDTGYRQREHSVAC